jgi:2-polyprenyl-3-methyl-5-hydroxy-6-metoxy-1,4-benzoquinol methylase
MALQYADDSFDVVTASQVLHHFSDAQVSRALNEMIRVARRMVIVSDLHRNRVAWMGIKIVSRMLGCGPMIRADGPLSVRKGFVRANLEAMAVRLREETGVRCEIRWHPMFRWGLVATKPGEA